MAERQANGVPGSVSTESVVSGAIKALTTAHSTLSALSMSDKISSDEAIHLHRCAFACFESARRLLNLKTGWQQ